MMQALVLLVALSTPIQVPAEGVAVSARVDPPAIWIADRVTYTIDLVCAPGVDILQEDLDRGKLALTGLELLSADTHRRTDGNHVAYTFEYVLTTYRVDVAAPAIGALRVRYFLTRAGQRAQDAAPAGTITIPPAVIAFRSLLPDDQAVYQVREGGAVPPRWLPYRLLRPIGLGLLLVCTAPAALVLGRLARAARRRRPASPRRTHRRARQAARAALEEMRTVNETDSRERRDAFIRLEALVREYLADAGGPELAAVTPDDARAAVAARCPQVPADLLTSVLESCEIARFAPPDAYPSAEAWRAALDHVETIVGTAPAR